MGWRPTRVARTARGPLRLDAVARLLANLVLYTIVAGLVGVAIWGGIHVSGLQSALTQYFNGTTTVSAIYGVTLNTYGQVTGYTTFVDNDTIQAPILTYGPSDIVDAAIMQAGGDSVDFAVAGGAATISLKSRGVAGTYDRANLVANDEGVITAISSPPILSDEVLFYATNVRSALESNFLLAEASTALPAGKVIQPNANAFIAMTSSGVYDITLRPRPLLGVNCSNPREITFDAEFGLAASCLGSPAPGMPGGAATLDGSGRLDISQFPDIHFGPTGVGGWDADTNTPHLDNATCTYNSSFFYLVDVGGNTTLGEYGTWNNGDQAVCLNGTWIRITQKQPSVISFNGRDGHLVPQHGDYEASHIALGNYTVADLAGYEFVMGTDSPALPYAKKLSGVANQTVASGVAIGLAPKPSFPLDLTVIDMQSFEIAVDHFGRVDSFTVKNYPIIDIVGTANQVIVSGTAPNVTLSLTQDIALTSDVIFNTVALGTGNKVIAAAGTGTAVVPDVGSADFVMTAGAQTVNGQKSLSSALVELADAGVALNNAANTFSTTVKAASGLAADTVFRLPPTAGAAGQTLTADGASGSAWVSYDFQSFTSSVAEIVTSGTFAPLAGMSFTTANAGAARYKVTVMVAASSGSSNVTVGLRMRLNDATTDSAVQYFSHADAHQTFGLLEAFTAVAPGSTFVVESNSSPTQAITFSYRSMIVEQIN
jgi:hypothetical protein